MTGPLDKIRKLLALAGQKDSPEEAAVAYATAQRLMERHAIDEETARAPAPGAAPDPALGRVERRFVYTSRPLGARPRTVPTHAIVLATAVASANRCQVFHAVGYGMPCYGHPSDLDAVELLLPAVLGEVERQIGLARKRGESSPGAAWAKGFRIGCANVMASRIRDAAGEAEAAARADAARPDAAAYSAAATTGDAERLLALDAARAAAPYALARVDAALERLRARVDAVDAHVAHVFAATKVRAGRSRSVGDYSGYVAGARAGRTADLTGPRGRLS